MRAAIWAAGLLAAGAGAALAGKGDPVAARRDGINVRAAPATTAEVLLRVGPEQAMVELASKGEWLFVNLPELRRRGWVHRSVVSGPDEAPDAAATFGELPSLGSQPLLDTAPVAANGAAALPEADGTLPEAAPSAPAAAAAPPPEPSATVALATPAVPTASGQEPPAVQEFRITVRALNERAKSLAGIDLFTDVRGRGGGQVDVLATGQWSTVPAAGRESFTNALYDQWVIIAGDLSPLAMQIVDPSGSVLTRRP
jgi:hypothetical protein